MRPAGRWVLCDCCSGAADNHLRMGARCHGGRCQPELSTFKKLRVPSIGRGKTAFWMNVPLASRLVLVSREPASLSMTRGKEHQDIGYNFGLLDSVEKQHQSSSKAVSRPRKS